MTEVITEKKHGFSEVTKPAGEDPSPPPQRGSTQSTVISPSFPDRLEGRVNVTIHEDEVDWADHHSPVADWASCPEPEIENTPVRSSKRKRPRTDHGPLTPELSCEGDAGTQHQPPIIPRYLVVESVTPDRPLTKCNIFAVNKWFKGVSTLLFGRVRKAGHCFIVDCPTEKVSKMLLLRDGSDFISLRIKVSAHRTLNSSKGVIWCPDLEGIEDAEILENLQSEGVSQVERCMKKKGGIKVPTHTLFLTFSKPTLPESIIISCYLKCKVTLFQPKPLQCFTCFRFGHPSAKCKKKDKPTCGRCGHEAHENACPQKALCPNCKGAHAPTSRQCPAYKKEALIKKIMVQKKIPFKEARLEAEREIEGSVPQKGKSYANAASAAIGMQAPTPNPPAPTKKPQKQSQNGQGLPNAIRAEALALAIDLRETLRTKNSSNAKPNAPRSNGAKQTPKSNPRGPAKPAQAKPGKTTAPAPQAAVAKPAQKAGKKKSKAAAPAPQAAAATRAAKPDNQPAPKAGHLKDPASAPQVAGSQAAPSEKQAPVQTPSASAPQAAEVEQAVEIALPSSDNESEMEVTSASAPQAAEVEQDPQPVTSDTNDLGDGSQSTATSPNSLKKGFSFAAAAKERAQAKETKKPDEGYKFEMKLAKQRARRPWSKNSRPKSIEPPVSTQNRFGALGCSDWTGSQDPEELDDYASFPEN